MFEILILVIFIMTLVMCICVERKLDDMVDSIRSNRNKIYDLMVEMENLKEDIKNESNDQYTDESEEVKMILKES